MWHTTKKSSCNFQRWHLVNDCVCSTSWTTSCSRCPSSQERAQRCCQVRRRVRGLRAIWAPGRALGQTLTSTMFNLCGGCSYSQHCDCNWLWPKVLLSKLFDHSNSSWTTPTTMTWANPLAIAGIEDFTNTIVNIKNSLKMFSHQIPTTYFSIYKYVTCGESGEIYWSDK